MRVPFSLLPPVMRQREQSLQLLGRAWARASVALSEGAQVVARAGVLVEQAQAEAGVEELQAIR